jgi:hypothetical protein
MRGNILLKQLNLRLVHLVMWEHSFEFFNDVSGTVVCDDNEMSCIMDYLLRIGEL